jgi:hypothetical protein
MKPRKLSVRCKDSQPPSANAAATVNKGTTRVRMAGTGSGQRQERCAPHRRNRQGRHRVCGALDIIEPF